MELEVQHWVALVFVVLEVFVYDPELDVFAEVLKSEDEEALLIV